ncbi:MAG: primosomal protein N', partial [Oscillospiraceae bacterium]|nr:primosomal protein N' [Oscillospiraceae bacterium]
DIVVGTRSAVFAPLRNLGLIILDEEQEHTYRSESSPRYSAHDVAKLRAAQHASLLLFASATPSVETYQAAQSGRYQLVRLAHRYEGRPLPTVEVVDMRAEIAKGNPGEISLPLAKAIGDNLEAGRQTILLLNRRGYRTVAQCGDCGHVVKCGGCSVPMVYHKAKGQLLCHYCGRTIAPPPTACPECGGPLRYTGFGTQKLEEELGGLFPEARILRMDQDTTGQKNAHEERLAKFAAHEYDIMLGTQMVAKGLDFEKVTLVGVVGIDSMLFSQSFRAFETAFSLVTQVVGRGGRADMPGHAIIQTNDPEHPVLRLAARQDYDSFFEQEIMFRKLGLYPPFCSICVVGFSGGEDAMTLAAAGRFAALLREEAVKQPELPLRVLGPAPMNVLMVNGRYRYKLTLKCRNDRTFRAMLGRVLGRYSDEGLPARAAVTVDLNSDGDL